MARLQLSKSSLSRESNNLKTYKKFLPSLDLKRQELMAQRAKAEKTLAQTRREIDQHISNMAADLPMLSNERVNLDGLVRVQHVEIGDENIMGAHLPVLNRVQVEISDYSLLAKPQWVDAVAYHLKEMLTLKIRLQVEEHRVELLNHAVRVITQRVNLFDKVLIPRARENIKRIKIYLSDAERAAVVNAKIAKNKRLLGAGL